MKRNELIAGLRLLALAPPFQESSGFLGIDWWVWILAGVLLLLLLLIIGFIMQNEPGPPIPERESKMYVTASSAAKAEEEKPEPEPEAEPEPEPEEEPESEPKEEPEPEPEVEPAPEAEPIPKPGPDDLKKIEGIGPKVAELLNEIGITTFEALAEADVERLNEILKEAELQYMDPSSWPEQAALAARKDWEAFEKLTAELKGGRRES